MTQPAQWPIGSQFSNPLLKSFLAEPENQRLFCQGEAEELERRFADHYFERRFLSFIRKHIHYEAQHLLRRLRRKQQVEPLLLNRKVSDEEGTGFEAVTLLADRSMSVEERVVGRTIALADLTSNEQLHVALQTLSPKQQLVLHLLFVEGLSEPEAADTLSISQQAVNKSKGKALEQIRRQLGVQAKKAKPRQERW